MQNERASKSSFVAEPGTTRVVITHMFDAPPAVIFRMYSDPKILPQWWGPGRLTTVVEKMELKKGGVWRFVQRDVEGNLFSFNGVYHEVLPPQRIVDTFEFEGMPGHVSLETVTFEEVDGKTKVTTVMVFQSVEDRDASIEHGMKDGVLESAERFRALLLKEGAPTTRRR